MKIIGLSGTNGSGKDTIGELLAEKHNFLFVSVTDLLRDEAISRGLNVERENLRNISAEWRREHGLGVLIDKAIEKFNTSNNNYTGVVIASLRNPGEVDRVHELNGKVIWVDAKPKIRYQRIYSRQRSNEDNKTYEQFLEEEAIEMNHTGDKATLNMSGVKDKSDLFIQNNGNDIEKFKVSAEIEIQSIL